MKVAGNGLAAVLARTPAPETRTAGLDAAAVAAAAAAPLPATDAGAPVHAATASTATAPASRKGLFLPHVAATARTLRSPAGTHLPALTCRDARARRQVTGRKVTIQLRSPDHAEDLAGRTYRSRWRANVSSSRRLPRSGLSCPDLHRCRRCTVRRHAFGHTLLPGAAFPSRLISPERIPGMVRPSRIPPYSLPWGVHIHARWPPPRRRWGRWLAPAAVAVIAVAVTLVAVIAVAVTVVAVRSAVSATPPPAGVPEY
jgi:hypothetical protein